MNIASLLNFCSQKRVPYLQPNHFDAYRLYDKEDPLLPLGIDLYKDNAVIYLFAKVKGEILRQVENFLRKHFDIQQFFYKNKTKDDLKLPPSPSHTIVIQEYGHKFFLNLSDYLDTGIFLDHRETRRWVGTKSRGKTVLNLFAYTGSFSIYAAKNGAAKTVSVDLSQTYCDWIKKNLELNHLPLEKNWVFKMDTFEFYKYALRKKMRFDIIIIDPPTFSRHKGKNFSVERDHPLLINTALELLNPHGFILFSNNKRGFKIKKSELTPCRIKNFKQQTWPPDFSDRETHHCFLIEPM